MGYTRDFFKILSSKFLWVGNYVSRQEITKNPAPGQLKKGAGPFSIFNDISDSPGFSMKMRTALCMLCQVGCSHVPTNKHWCNIDVVVLLSVRVGPPAGKAC